MNKKFLISALVIFLVGVGLKIFLSRDIQPGNQGGYTEKEINQKKTAMVAQSGETNVPAQAVLVPVDWSHPLRLAIGGLGLTDEDNNRQLGDLVTVGLTGERGFNLVERQSLAAILHELNLNWSGFVRAKDAVRVGKLLKADWFLLGTEAKINGTNSIVVRVVDARTGVMRDAGVFPADQPSTQLAADLAAFLRQCRQNAASPKPRVYLAVGAFEDLSANNRQADFPAQVRGYLTAAYQGSHVTLLEREYVETLLQEVRLDLAGLTEEGGTNSPSPIQSAFWLVSGQYQSYETTNIQVEVKLDVRRVFGKSWQRNLRGLPGESVGRQIKTAIDEVMNQNSGALTPTRLSESRLQMGIGREIVGWGDDWSLIVVGARPLPGKWRDGIWKEDPQAAPREKRRLQDAIRAFETVLLLEPANREAKLRLAACFREQLIRRIDEARNYYREVIDEPVQDKWSDVAQRALVETLLWYGPEENLRWLQSAAEHTTNAAAIAFYRAQAQIKQDQVTMRSGDSTNAVKLAEKQLYESFQSFKNVLEGESGSSSDDMGMDDFINVCRWDQATAATKLAEMLPVMQQRAPGLEPYLLATVLTYQTDTNTPLMVQFQQVLDDFVEHNNHVLGPEQFWNKIRWSVYDWCLKKTNYALAIRLMEGERRAGAEGMIDFNDQEKVKLGYAYMDAQRWPEAFRVFQSFSNKPVRAEGDGQWGNAFQPILTGKLADYCRRQLGQTAEQNQNPRQFDMGKPILCMHTHSSFAVDENSIWVGIEGQLLQLDFGLKTNLAVSLPLDNAIPITVILPTATSVWIGTQGAGLIEFDKTTKKCRRFTEGDGLMMNDLTVLNLAGDSLWIGYGNAVAGGLGSLDLRSGKINSYMASLKADQPGEGPPRSAVGNIVASADGDLKLFAANAVRQFHVARSVWETLPKANCDWVACFAADSAHLAEGGGIGLIEIGIQDKPSRGTPTNDFHRTNMIVSSAELQRLEENLRTNGTHRYVCSTASGGIRPKGVLAIQNLRDQRWQNLEDADGFPNPPDTLVIDGDNLWVGGEATITLVDLKTCKVRKICHIKGANVNRIQIAGGYVWAQFDGHLHRAPLSTVQ